LGLEVTESDWPIVFMRWRTGLRAEGRRTLVAQEREYQLKFGVLGRVMDALVMRRKLEQASRRSSRASNATWRFGGV
jgi:hypothetical protein